jgi:hypothetical protein
VVNLLMVNDCDDVTLMSLRLMGSSHRGFKDRAGVILAVYLRHVLGVRTKC